MFILAFNFLAEKLDFIFFHVDFFLGVVDDVDGDAVAPPADGSLLLYCLLGGTAPNGLPDLSVLDGSGGGW